MKKQNHDEKMLLGFTTDEQDRISRNAQLMGFSKAVFIRWAVAEECYKQELKAEGLFDQAKLKH